MEDDLLSNARELADKLFDMKGSDVRDDRQMVLWMKYWNMDMDEELLSPSDMIADLDLLVTFLEPIGFRDFPGLKLTAILQILLGCYDDANQTLRVAKYLYPDPLDAPTIRPAEFTPAHGDDLRHVEVCGHFRIEEAALRGNAAVLVTFGDSMIGRRARGRRTLGLTNRGPILLVTPLNARAHIRIKKFLLKFVFTLDCTLISPSLALKSTPHTSVCFVSEANRSGPAREWCAQWVPEGGAVTIDKLPNGVYRVAGCDDA